MVSIPTLLMNVEKLCWDFEVFCIVTFVYMSNTCIFVSCEMIVKPKQCVFMYYDVDNNNAILYVYLQL